MIDIYSKLPKTFGIYIFKDEKNKILYVGKAINLKSRVSSYFNKSILDPKTQALVSKIKKIDHIVVSNELEALVLEAEFIKRNKPPYNINLKDDKFYQYIKIYNRKIKKDKKTLTVKLIGTTRKKAEDNAKYFGPYPKATSIYIILRSLRKTFPYMNCSQMKFSRHRKLLRPCIYGQIGLCPKPCVNDEYIKINNKNIDNIELYLSGKKDTLFKKLEKQMKKLAKEQKYEEASIIRDQINSYKYITQKIEDSDEYTKDPNTRENTATLNLEKLINALNKKGLNIKNKENFRIETYDISNFQGNFAVGSMVVSINGLQDNDEYRKFKINQKNTPDDFAMMQEMLERRFTNVKLKKKLPDLIVIDGGKGQLSSVLKIFNNLGIKIPIIGLAKREEEVVLYIKDKFEILALGANAPELQILIRGRNEAHRFAISYYRKLHRKALLEK